jgi:hypothetical protein
LFFVADIVYLISTYKKEVKFEEDYSKSIVDVGNLLFGRKKEDSEFLYNNRRLYKVVPQAFPFPRPRFWQVI